MNDDTQPDLDPAEFRKLCGRFATGVVIVTAIAKDGTPMGMTANSFTSVSLVPPMISINVDQEAEFHETIVAVTDFAINILDASQESISRRFASTPGSARFSGVSFETTDRGQIHLTGAMAVIECCKTHQIPIGDHTVVVGRVVGGGIADGRPLLYFRGGYHGLA